jgi:hypothetical protein
MREIRLLRGRLPRKGRGLTGMFVDEENVHMAQIESWKNKIIDGFYTKTTQKGGFSKLCVKVKKKCYTDLLYFSTRKHNLVSFFGRIVF